MSAPLKWFPFYIDDWSFDEAVRFMTYEERGIYLDLLIWQWREGSIPHDLRRLARVLRAPTAAIRTVVKRGFWDDGNHVGRLINPKLAELRVKQLTKAGRASDNARGWKTTEDRFLYAAVATVHRRDNDGRDTTEQQIKIGWSRNPKARLASIRRESQRPMEMIGSRVATISLERKAHADLALHKIEGEWFRDVPAVRQWLDTSGVTGSTDGISGGLGPDPNGDTIGRSRSRIRSEIKKSLSASAVGQTATAARPLGVT